MHDAPDSLPSTPPSVGWCLVFLAVTCLFVYGIVQMNARETASLGGAIGAALGIAFVASGIYYLLFARHHQKLRVPAGIAILGAAAIGVLLGNREQADAYSASINSLEAVATGTAQEYDAPKANGLQPVEQQILDIIGRTATKKNAQLTSYKQLVTTAAARIYIPERLLNDKNLVETFVILDSVELAFADLVTFHKTSKYNLHAELQALALPIVQKDKILRMMSTDSLDDLGQWIAMEKMVLERLHKLFSFLRSEPGNWTFTKEAGLKFQSEQKQTRMITYLQEIKAISEQQKALQERSQQRVHQSLELMREAQ